MSLPEQSGVGFLIRARRDPMKKQVFLTTSWDDGYPSDDRVADLLTRHGLRGTFYVPLHSQRPTMEKSQIRSLSSAFEIGGHTINHADLTQLGEEEARKEIGGCKRILEELTGKPCKMFCFPKGHYRSSHLRLVRQGGFLGARTVELMSLDLPGFDSGVAVMPTTLQAQAHDRLTYLKNIGKRFAFNNLLNLLRCGSCNWVDCAERLLRRVAEQGGVFHLWGHSWELDAQDRWSELDQVLRLMAGLKTDAQAATNAEVCQHAIGAVRG